ARNRNSFAGGCRAGGRSLKLRKLYGFGASLTDVCTDRDHCPADAGDRDAGDHPVRDRLAVRLQRRQFLQPVHGPGVPVDQFAAGTGAGPDSPDPACHRGDRFQPAGTDRRLADPADRAQQRGVLSRGMGRVMARPFLLAACAALALAGGASGPQRQPMGDGARALLRASPSAVIAAEMAFARMAREQGTWTAFRYYAASDALRPSPGWTNVHQSLSGAADPAQPIVRAPDAVWMSCDGSVAASTGEAALSDGRPSRLLTHWQRQGNGEYRWVLDQGFDSEGIEKTSDMIAGKTA